MPRSLAVMISYPLNMQSTFPLRHSLLDNLPGLWARNLKGGFPLKTIINPQKKIYVFLNILFL